MLQVPINVDTAIAQMVPSCMKNEIACFVFYDRHPRERNDIDIIICTINGEVKEFYKREQVSSLLLSVKSKPEHVKILRNSKFELFYLVATKDELHVLERKENIRILKTVSNVASYELKDQMCQGLPIFKVRLNGDAIPLIFDDSYQTLSETRIERDPDTTESIPIITQLKRKLTEAQYIVKCNEGKLKEITELRQRAEYSMYQKANGDCDHLTHKTEFCDKEIIPPKINSLNPWVKVCNNKIVIAFQLHNENKDSFEDIYLLLHGSPRPCMVYKTRLFAKIQSFPFWKEKLELKLNKNEEIAVVAVIDLKEIKDNISSKIHFTGVISYRSNGRNLIFPFINVNISSMDTMAENFDVLSSTLFTCNDLEACNNVLAILATTERLDLRLIPLKQIPETLSNVFIKYLQMEGIFANGNVLIHRKSPYHILNGFMVKIHRCPSSITSSEVLDKRTAIISVYARSPSQILAFIHYMYDAIPYRILVTTIDQIVTNKTDSQSNYDLELADYLEEKAKEKKENKIEYASIIIKQTDIILKYLDECMMKMNVSKDPIVQNIIGREIDLYAGGEKSYLEFRSKLNSANMQENEGSVEVSVSPDVIIIDSGELKFD